ncbi:MAG: reverse transcriptase/maturase family protein [Candidatus Moraniibacteriota bacterium]
MGFDYDELICVENLLDSWWSYRRGKNRKKDVMEFERHLEDNIFLLCDELKTGNYSHGRYSYFRISDPKKRDIYKATVRDRVIHQALYTYLCSIYEPLFIKNSFSSRKGKGTHRAVATLQKQIYLIRRYRKRCWAIKCDIRKYFENINHEILLDLLRKEIRDEKIFALLEGIVRSFHTDTGTGVPLGNITSQVFANVYLNELDRFVENDLVLKSQYVRYNDDFVILGNDEEKLFEQVRAIRKFLHERLVLELPLRKTVFRKLKWGIDFCGSIIVSNGILLRDKSKKRMFRAIKSTENKLDLGKISPSDFRKILDSYFGLLSHCKAYGLKCEIRSVYLHGSPDFLYLPIELPWNVCVRVDNRVTSKIQ